MRKFGAENNIKQNFIAYRKIIFIGYRKSLRLGIIMLYIKLIALDNNAISFYQFDRMRFIRIKTALFCFFFSQEMTGSFVEDVVFTAFKIQKLVHMINLAMFVSRRVGGCEIYPLLAVFLQTDCCKQRLALHCSRFPGGKRRLAVSRVATRTTYLKLHTTDSNTGLEGGWSRNRSKAKQKSFYTTKE